MRFVSLIAAGSDWRAMGRWHHRKGMLIGSLLSQSHHDLGKHTHITPTLPAIIQRLWWPILRWRLALH
jgi:hypothetical protein